MTEQRRQGDLFFTATNQIPSGEAKDDAVLAYGEVTGHKHFIVSPSLDEVDMLVDEDGCIWLHSLKDIVISHDEHGDVTLPAGKQYKMIRQREYDPMAADRERKVAD